MKKALFSIQIMLLAGSVLAAPETNRAPGEDEAKYTQVIEGRAADILKILDIADTNRVAKVHDAIVAQYRALRAWHDDHDAKLNAARGDTNALAQIHESLMALHNEFITKLSANLTPEQVEKVKDKMTYGKVQFTYAGYVAQYPGLSDANKERILDLLKAAREQAMDGGSAEEKTAIFQRYKGKINNYLSEQGIHPTKQKPAVKPPTNE